VSTRIEIADVYANSVDPSFAMYSRQSLTEELLTIAEERELPVRIQAGDDLARERMIKANLKLVVSIARDYEGFGASIMDLISVGNMGLMRAIKKFNPGRGNKFSTYAAFWIKQKIKQELSKRTRIIRIPIHVIQRHSKARKLRERGSTDGEIIDAVGISEKQLLHCARAMEIRTISLDTPVSEDSSTLIGDMIPDPNSRLPGVGEPDDRHRIMIESFRTLTLKERDILTRRFGLNDVSTATLEIIGVDYNVTRERIRQLEFKALRKLRNAIETSERRSSPDHPLSEKG